MDPTAVTPQKKPRKQQVFDASYEWREVPLGMAVPAGCQINMDVKTGKTFAKLKGNNFGLPWSGQKASKPADLSFLLSSKWVITGLAICCLLWRRDGFAFVVLIGVLPSNVITKTMKYVLNHSRPATAGTKCDPGMPSSHATTFFYLAAFLSLSLTSLSLSLMFALPLFVGACVLSWWRVHRGFHTLSQVAAGAVVGTVWGFAWWFGASTSLGHVLDAVLLSLGAFWGGVVSVVCCVAGVCLLGPLHRLWNQRYRKSE